MTTVSPIIQKQRIEFIDLAKGFCIFLVVMKHCDALVETPALSMIRMPLYFILSGLFFKTYGSIKNLTLKKTNKLLIPMITFFLLGELAYLIASSIKPELMNIPNRSIIDIFTKGTMFNIPVWFLLSLFWCNFIFVIIVTYIKSEICRIMAIILIGTVGYQFGKHEIDIPLFIDTSMSALPFFCLGYYLKNTSILYPNSLDKYNWAFCIFFGLIASTSLLFQIFTNNSYFSNKLHGGIWMYFFSCISVAFILTLCKIIKRVPLISYVGRYSIIILVLHYIIKRPATIIAHSLLDNNSDNIGWIVFIVTMTINISLIPICKRYIPYVVAQKDLIKTN